MSVKKYIISILAIFTIQITSAKSPEADTVKRNHLLVKFDIFYPVAYLFVDDDKRYAYGGAFEYKFKSRFSSQLSAYVFQYYDGYLYQNGFNIIPEGRYYFKGHFVGAFIKYEQRSYEGGAFYTNRINDWIKNEFHWTLGGLYGYQVQFGRFNAEGRLGIGIAHDFFRLEWPNNNEKSTKKGDLFPEMILAINIGYRIF